ncbi:MAG: RHS repeat-associated core domain-containing protein [Candidatus Acidiferrales bacterium]
MRGYEQDQETGLYYAMARYYNPRLGRFMTPDPLMGDIRNPQTLNRYAYVANNPLNLIDPSGLHEEDEGPPYTCVVGGNVIEGEDNCILAQLQADDPCGTGTGPCDSFGGGDSGSPGLTPDKKALANCINAQFGVSLLSFTPSAPGQNGSFTGAMAGAYTGYNQPLAPGPSQFTVTNNVNKYSGSQLAGVAAANGQLQPGESIGGYTFFNNPYENYTANDLSSYNGGGGVPGGIPIPDPAFADLETQIFELGNSLAVLTDTVPQNVNSTPGPANTEPGTRLLNCFNKGGPKAGS